MNLASHYAALLSEGLDPEKVLALIKRKGHQSLLPRIVRAFEAGKKEGSVVTVAKREDVESASSRFPEAKIIVDPRIVGGYLAKIKGAKIVDATYRRALVTIYKSATRA